MKCLDRFNKKMNLQGGSLRNEKIKNSRNLLQKIFTDDASFRTGIYLWQSGIVSYDEKETLNIRLYNERYSSANGNTIKFQTLIDTPVIVGDILYDSEFERYYLCTESFNIDSIHWQGKLVLCNWILKWQNKNGDILEYPCYDINSTQYNSGEMSNKQFTVGSSQHMITLPCDENTVILSPPQRFFLDKNKDNPTSFIVTQNDTTSYNIGKKGIVKITLYECEKNNEKDRIDLGICDYMDKNSLLTDNSDNTPVAKSVINYTTNVIKSGGGKQIFAGKFYDDKGNEIKDISAKWDIVCDFKNNLEVNQSDNQIQIGIDNDDYVDEEFKLILSDNEDNYSSSLIIRIESLL